MGTQKQDWTIWVRNPHPFPDEGENGRSSINDAIADVFNKGDIEYQTPYSEYHVVTVRHATRAMTERVAQTIHALHIQRMHETRYYPVQGWCSVEIREGTDEQSIPEWVIALDDARVHQRQAPQDEANRLAPCFVPAELYSAGTSIVQEIVGYLFNNRSVCHRCVFSDMGLLEYTFRRGELLEQAIWDTHEQLSTLFCFQCHHPLIAIVVGKRQSLPYKDVAAFVQRNGLVCYIPPLVRHSNLVRRYRYEDFLSLAQGNEMQAASLLARCAHEIPEHVLPQLEGGSRCL